MSWKKHWKCYVNIEELKHKVGLRAAKRIKYLKLHHTSNNTYLILENVYCSFIRIGFNLQYFWGDISAVFMPTCYLQVHISRFQDFIFDLNAVNGTEATYTKILAKSCNTLFFKKQPLPTLPKIVLWKYF